MSKGINKFSSDNFNEQVLKSKEVVLVDFFAVWCSPCRLLSPIIEELAEDYEGKIKIGKLNVDDAIEIAEKYDVMTIPTVLLFKDGEVKGKIVGLHSKADYSDLIDSNIDNTEE